MGAGDWMSEGPNNLITDGEETLFAAIEQQAEPGESESSDA
ncbi:hypothetical protein [Streptomyces lomondensis]|uniref:Uncharacterized protein n=1 Tax=Streptomyces lomondensis TaxID=68229 RepID=A0ABQ2XIL9_9ACTN|nr:hypothetical protein [Streptomyces lomondensis]GGX18953.1 hypothetical protein GCM10010383_56210 [Streptomyces lomondensis]